MGLNVHVHVYDDREWLPRLVESVRDVLGEVPIHILDGRYELFPGETDLTPGLEGWCAESSGVHYHAPPAERLPFGHDLDAPPAQRPGGHAKAAWAFADVLPSTEWTLKLDADERLQRFDRDLTECTRTHRYCPMVDRAGVERANGRAYIARLFVPEHWTPWIDDCLLPRALFPRDTPLRIRARFWRERDFRPFRTVRLAMAEAIEIQNHGTDRDNEWADRRREHLAAIERDDHPVL